MKHLLARTVPGRRSGWAYGLLLLSILALLLAACGNSSQTQPTQRTQATLPPPPPIGGLPPVASGLQPQGQIPLDIRLQLTIGLTTNRQALARDLAALYDPTSPQFGHYLSPQELAARYGASQASIAQVTAYLKSQGFEVRSVSPLRNSIQVTATVGQIAQAFHITLQTFQMQGKTVFGPNGTITLPPALQSLVTSVVGLSSFAQPVPLLMPGASRSPDATRKQAAADCAGLKQSGGVTPGQLATAYRYADAYKAGYTGKGISIGVIEFNDDVDVNDLNTFLACTTGGKLHRSLIRVNGGAVAPDPLSTGEATLDFEYLSALAPDAQLIEYQTQYCNIGCGLLYDASPFPQAFAALLNQIAADGNVQVVSISWGGEESIFTKDEIFALDQAIQYLAAEGVTTAVASGDCGAFGGGTYKQLSVDFPAADPYALAVGGTFLHTDAAGKRTSEPVWVDANPDQSRCLNSWGSGGGLSTLFSQPTWQQGPGVKNQYANGKRQVPDVAAAAFNLPIYQGGSWSLSGGTSAAAPIWAAGIALVDQSLQQHHRQLVGATPTFYRLLNKAGKLHPYYDITQGTNLYYPATAGYDLTTGWGAPNLIDFGKALGAF